MEGSQRKSIATRWQCGRGRTGGWHFWRAEGVEVEVLIELAVLPAMLSREPDAGIPSHTLSVSLCLSLPPDSHIHPPKMK